MPKSAKKYYAVAVGRDGPNIYDTWDECKMQTARYPAVFKSFPSRQQAEQWLANQIGIRDRKHPASGALTLSHQSGACPDQPGEIQDYRPLPDPEFRDAFPPDPAPFPRAGCSSHLEAMQDDHPLVLSRPAVQLSPEQQQVLDKVRSGHSVFFTGSAGTGKSVLLREIIDTLKERGDTLGITASTGIAAVNIGGSTLHSWAGIGLGDQPAKRYIGKFFGNEQSRKILDRWKNVDTLIIDEVSMIDGSLFDKLEHIAREVRYNDHPFGGIQLVLSGDFCQLPPVSGRDKQGRQISPVFAFDANTWDACVGSPVILTRVFRQKDQHFIDMLNAMRFGQINDKSAFTALSRKVEYADGIEPTELFSTRSEVDNANTFRLGQLKTEARIYTANDIPGTDSNGVRVTPVQMARLLERLVVPKKIHLKVCKTFPQGLV
ncbi:hypothetical protein H2248_012563 [Termitomyces sp. 'cryptogamus']|nr:hypothetical protein H2248_012563 [Termitomyces sp. 'cryptogamus']